MVSRASMRTRRLLYVCASLICLAAAFFKSISIFAANPIQMENAKPGTTAWQLTNPATNREIEGYASLTSVNRGGQISLFVNTNESNYTINVYRMGWYGGAGARLVAGPIARTGTAQTTPAPDPATGLVDCNWTNPYVLSIPNSADPTDWASGIYLAQLTAGTSGKQSYILFVVRDDARASNYLYQNSVTTYQAYNNWGGKSLYSFNSAGSAARKVSFNRPYAMGQDPAHAVGMGAGEFLTNLSIPAGSSVSKAGWEYSMVRFLEREGYDVTYCTNIDTHTNPSAMLLHKGFLSVGHDEYWTAQMRANIESARDQGVSLGFFSADACFWQIRLEASAATGGANRTIVGYKDFALTEDPLALDGNPANDHLITRRWRETPINKPEDALIGVMYEFDPVNADMVITNAGHWVCAGTGLVNGSVLPGLVGYEVDRFFGNAPANTVLIAHSPYQGGAKFSDMSVYTAASGATVFAVGTMQWNWGLDNYGAPSLHPALQSAAAQQMTRNVLAAFLNAPVPPPAPPTSPNDDFNDNARDTAKWNFGAMQAGAGSWDLGLPVLEQNARLEIAPRASQSGNHYNGYVSASAWDLTDGSASVEVVQVAGGGSADTYLALCVDGQNFYSMIVEGGRLYFQQAVGGVKSTTNVAYSNATQRFWRIRHDQATDTIVFETSPDRTTWTTQRTVARQINITALKFEMSAGTYEPVTTPGTAIFDSFRLDSNHPNQLPTANPGGPYSGTTAAGVAFNGGGSSDPDGSIVNYQWSFGDSGIGSGAAPTHTYTAVGTYTVTLTVTDNRGGTNTATTSVTISLPPNQLPVANAGGPYTGTTNQAVSFNGGGSSDPDGSITGYQWNFGDGSNGSGASPTHSYAAAGTYTVSLTVTDNRGGTNTATTSATISLPPNQLPVANAGGPYTGTTGQAVSFNGGGSSDPDGTITGYQWNFGDGGTATGATPTHAYTAAGTYTVSLTVTDNRGGTNTATTTATISLPPNQLPVANAGGPYTGTTGVAVAFNGGGSSDPDGTIASYQWNFGDGSTGSGASPTHAYAATGAYTVSLTVTDNRGGTHTATTSASIGLPPNQLPTAAPGGPYTGTAGQAVALNGAASSDPDGTIASYQWNFGDGGTGTGANPTRTYAAAGTYTVTLTVTDNRGGTHTATTTATIAAAAPAPPTPPSTQNDDFNDNTRDTAKWGLGSLTNPGAVDTLLPVLEQNGRLEIAPRAGQLGLHYHGYLSPFTWNLTNANASVEVVQAAAGSADTQLVVGIDALNFAMMEVENGRLYFMLIVGGNGTPTSIVYSPTLHRFWRIRHDPAADTLVFETSPDRTNWTAQRTVARPWPITALKVALAAGTFEPVATPGTAIFDSFRIDANPAAPIPPANQSPVARPGGPYTGTVGQAVAMSGSSSSDPDGTITSHQWSFGDGSNGSGASPTHAYAAPGTYTLTLTVTDNGGATASASTTVTITAAPNQTPVANTGGPYAGTPGQVIAFNGGGSSDPDGTIASYQWSFGDGGTATGATPTRSYAAAGTYTVTLTVTDNRGATASASTTVMVAAAANQLPVANPGGPYTGTTGTAVAFNGGGSSDPDGSISSYQWSFGDGTTGTGAITSHAYAAAGTYTVTLTVTDNRGGTRSTSTSVTITTATTGGTSGRYVPPSRR